jgi:hypothetical protein
MKQVCVTKPFLTGLVFFLVAGLGSACSTNRKPTPNFDDPCYVPNIRDDAVVQLTPHSEDVWVFENVGRVCFYPISPNKLQVSISPLECFSSGCTRIYERDGSLGVDETSYAIRMKSRFVVSDVRSSEVVCACADDCDGAGRLILKTSRLKEGIYSVKLGDTQIGQLAIPFILDRVCLTSETTATPFPSPAPPTHTPDSDSYPPPIETPLATPTPYVYP